MFNEYFKPPSVISITIFAVTLPPPDTVGASSSTTIDQDPSSPGTSPNNKPTTSIQCTNVEEPNKEEEAEVDSDIFTNPFTPPATSLAESSSRIVDTSNMHTFQQPHINSRRWTKDHPLVTIINNLSKPISTRRQLATDALRCYFHAFLTKFKPKNYKESMKKSCWIEAMQEEIYKFERLEVWELVPRLSNVMLINLKWIFKVKLDEYGGVLKNKARLVAKGYHQEDGIDFEESFTLMLKKYGLDQCDVVDILMVESSKLDVDPNGTSAKPTEKYITTVKRVFRYLKGTINMGLWYPKDTKFDLTAFADADHAGCQDSRKSKSRSAQFLGENLVSLSSKKQKCAAISTTEAKYVSLSDCYAQILWMRSQLTDYGFDYNKIPLYCDSKSVIALSCNTMQHFRTKHIAVRYHFFKEQVENEIVGLYFVKTAYQLVDIFTKALPRERFEFLIKRLGMQGITPEELKHLAEPYEE
ncbi:retrovirus-related pol polyprotein from transposon TNT 1-94 [Tanacetum coccineum]